MEVHVGSIDEEDDEQGIAHMIEHVAFLGSKKREKLLGTGARSNAYTDFHHTVFHIHSPTHAKVRCFYPSDIAIWLGHSYYMMDFQLLIRFKLKIKEFAASLLAPLALFLGVDNKLITAGTWCRKS